ncbi:MAG: LPS assembly lipoprotein LptE [Lentisphaeraceae bacterium]|nr:LPS assembly lipoprotein LptE [Lentisphaeraceae bacterium]
MKNTKLIISLICALFITACSNYKVGNIAHPQIKTIGIGEIKNSTDQPRLSFFLREKLKERFMQDASFKVVPVAEADVIISGKVVDYRINTRGRTTRDEREEEDEGFFSTIYRTSIRFKYEVKTRSHWEVTSGAVTEGADFTEIIDQFEEKRNALRRAAYEVAKKVVSEITEAW